MTADEIAALLGMVLLPGEGGRWVQTLLDDRSSAILYLLSDGDFSAMHRLDADEIYHHYAGDPVEMLFLDPDGSVDRPVLGSDLETGQRPQLVVPVGVGKVHEGVIRPRVGIENVILAQLGQLFVQLDLVLRRRIAIDGAKVEQDRALDVVGEIEGRLSRGSPVRTLVLNQHSDSRIINTGNLTCVQWEHGRMRRAEAVLLAV